MPPFCTVLPVSKKWKKMQTKQITIMFTIYLPFDVGYWICNKRMFLAKKELVDTVNWTTFSGLQQSLFLKHFFLFSVCLVKSYWYPWILENNWLTELWNKPLPLFLSLSEASESQNGTEYILMMICQDHKLTFTAPDTFWCASSPLTINHLALQCVTSLCNEEPFSSCSIYCGLFHVKNVQLFVV